MLLLHVYIIFFFGTQMLLEQIAICHRTVLYTCTCWLSCDWFAYR